MKKICAIASPDAKKVLLEGTIELRRALASQNAAKLAAWIKSPSAMVLMKSHRLVDLLRLKSSNGKSGFHYLIQGQPEADTGNYKRNPEGQLALLKVLEGAGVDFKAIRFRDKSGEHPISEKIFLLHGICPSDHYLEMYLRCIPDRIRLATAAEVEGADNKTTISLEVVCSEQGLYSLRDMDNHVTLIDNIETLTETLRTNAFFSPTTNLPLDLSWHDLTLLGQDSQLKIEGGVMKMSTENVLKKVSNDLQYVEKCIEIITPMVAKQTIKETNSAYLERKPLTHRLEQLLQYRAALKEQHERVFVRDAQHDAFRESGIQSPNPTLDFSIGILNLSQGQTHTFWAKRNYPPTAEMFLRPETLTLERTSHYIKVEYPSGTVLIVDPKKADLLLDFDLISVAIGK